MYVSFKMDVIIFRYENNGIFISVIKTNQFMMKVAQVAVCSQINTKAQTALFKDPVRTAL